MVSVIWKRNSSSIRIIASDDLEIHAWLNTFIKQWQGRKSKIAKSHQNTAINRTLSMERRASCQKIELLSKFMSLLTPPPPPPPPPHFRRIRGTFAHSSSPEPPYLVENIPPRSRQLVTIAFYKTHTFPGFSREIFWRQTPQTYPLPRENGNTHVTP